MPTIQGNVTRCDIRVPNDFYEKLERVAIERFNAKTHWKSGKPEITDTILKLLAIGLRHIDSDIIGDLSDTQDLEKMIEAIVIRTLSDKVVNRSDKPDSISQLSDLSQQVDRLQSQLEPILEAQKEIDRLLGK
jgi:vacuolar-type H+-ATPase subunit C/Vma6